MATENYVRTRKNHKHYRKTVGLLIDGIYSPYQRGIFSGLRDYLEERDLDFLCFISGRLHSQYESEKCRNVFFDFISEHTVDGLVITASSMGNIAGKKAMSDMVNNYTYLPMVTLGDTFEDVPYIDIDNENGMRCLLIHLIKKHGYRRFAFIKGNEGNKDADMRFNVFKQLLDEYKIPVNYDLVVEGDFQIDSGRTAMKRLIDEKHLDFDVIVSSNDDMALGVIEILRNRNIDFIGKIPIVGFDDIEISKYCQLTTVRQSFYDQGRLAGETIEKLLRGEKIATPIVQKAELIIRKSCGCNGKQEIKRKNKDVILTNEGTVQREIAFQKIFFDYHLEEFANINERLLANLELEDELNVIYKKFPEFGIRQCYISLYEDPGNPLSNSRLVLAYDQGKRFSIARKGIHFPTKSLLPPGILTKKDRYSLIIQALFQGYEQIGFALFGINKCEPYMYEILRHALSIAFKGAKLINRLKQYNEHLEDQIIYRTKELSLTNKQLEHEIRERRQSEEYFRELALFLPTIIFEIDSDLHFMFINKAGYEALGMGEGEALPSKNFIEYIHEDDEDIVNEFCIKILKHQITQYCEFRIIHKNNKSATIIGKAIPIIINNVVKGIRLSGINIKPFLPLVIMPEDLFFEHYRFSPRVKEVLILLLQGYKTKEIAKKLFIAENTVKAHIKAIYTEVGVDTRADLFKILEKYQLNHFGYYSYIYSILAKLIKE